MMKGFFQMGLQYWPARHGVAFWKEFDQIDLDADFKIIRSLNMKLVRVSLMWEDFQPAPDQVSKQAVENLHRVLDAAWYYRIRVQPSFFYGHVDGVNFVPSWLLASTGPRSLYPTVSDGRLIEGARIRNVMEDPDLLRAQCLLLREVVVALKDHPALYGWDIGGGVSCFWPAMPPSPLPESEEPLSVLRWNGRPGRRDRVAESRLMARQQWRVSVLDEDVDAESWGGAARPRHRTQEMAPPPPAVSSQPPRPPVIRPIRPSSAPIFGVSQGLAIFDTPPVCEANGELSERAFQAAAPRPEELAQIKPPAPVVPEAHSEQPVEVPVGVPSRDAGVAWLSTLVATIRNEDRHHAISVSLEGRDLEAVTPLWLPDVSRLVDFTGLRVHADEAPWSRSPLDTMVLPFAGFLGEALSGARVAMLDAGFPMVREEVYHSGRLLSYSVLHDIEASDLMATVLEGVLHMGATAAFLGSFSDFDPRLFDRPPLAQTPRARWSGLLRLDGSFKPAAHVARDFAAWDHPLLSPPFRMRLQAERVAADPGGAIVPLYEQFLEALGDR
ncbi:MAG: glycoside hydrolase 5 family protein [Candidatus Xenobia bacterium]